LKDALERLCRFISPHFTAAKVPEVERQYSEMIDGDFGFSVKPALQ
jgi:hypothetical protein